MRLAATFDDTGREGQIVASGKVPGEDTSGGWVFHCHILEHVDQGMMSLQVVESDPEGSTRARGPAAGPLAAPRQNRTVVSKVMRSRPSKRPKTPRGSPSRRSAPRVSSSRPKNR